MRQCHCWSVNKDFVYALHIFGICMYCCKFLENLFLDQNTHCAALIFKFTHCRTNSLKEIYQSCLQNFLYIVLSSYRQNPVTPRVQLQFLFFRFFSQTVSVLNYIPTPSTSLTPTFIQVMNTRLSTSAEGAAVLRTSHRGRCCFTSTAARWIKN